MHLPAVASGELSLGQRLRRLSDQQVARVRASGRDWLRSRLRRWLALPVIGLSLALGLAGAFAGYHAIALVMDGTHDEGLIRSATNDASVVSEEIARFVEAAGRLAEFDEVGLLLAPESQGPAMAELGQAAGLIGVESLSLLKLSEDTGADNPARPEIVAQWGAVLPLEQGITQTLYTALATGGGQEAAQVGFVGDSQEPLLYVVRSIERDGIAQGLLIVGATLRSVVGLPDGGDDQATVVYDREGMPLASTVGDAISQDDAPVLAASQLVRGDDGPRVTHNELPGGDYVRVVVPLTVGDAALGYLGQWRPSDFALPTVRSVQVLVVLIIVAGTLGLLAVTMVLTRRLVHPVLALVESAGRVARGDSRRLAGSGSVGELGLLVDAVNHMADRLEQQATVLREQAHLSTYLFEASAELGRTLDFDESLQTAADALYGLGRLSYVVVLAGRGELGPYTCKAARGLPPEVSAGMSGREYRIPLWGVMGRALVSRQPLVIHDVVAEQRPRSDEFDWDIGTGSVLLFPVSGANGPFALIIAGAREAQAFTSGNLGDHVFALARISSHSIQNARLYQEAMRSQEQLVTLQAISKLVTSTVKIEEILDVVLREAAEVTAGGQSWLVLKDPVSGASEQYGRTQGLETRAWDATCQAAVEWVTAAGEPIFFDPSQALPPSPILTDSGPAMCVPMEVGEQSLGGLVVVSKRRRPFVEDDMIVLRTVVNAATVALRTAQLAKRLEDGYVRMAGMWVSTVERQLWGASGHAQRVAANVLTLAQATKLSTSLWPALQLAAQLHDIALEEKEEELQLDCGEEIVRHAEKGANLLAQAGVEPRVVTLVRCHHASHPEQVIADAELSRAATILALCNIVDAWLGDSSAGESLEPAEIRRRLKTDVGGHFNPTVAEELIGLMFSGRLVLPSV